MAGKGNLLVGQLLTRIYKEVTHSYPLDSCVNRMVSQNQLILKNEIMDKLLKYMSKIKEFGVEKIGVFGSLLKGETTGDVDILISFKENEESFHNLIDLYYLLKDTINAQIDIVTTNVLSPYIGPYILREVEYIKA